VPLEVPRFTHIRQDQSGIGTKAVKILQAMIEGQSPSLQHVLSFELIEGRSTARVRKLEVTS
jgi:GntR family transcriptional regulator, arabinose operon transcriptional repressor